jgi:hypothetical protein
MTGFMSQNVAKQYPFEKPALTGEPLDPVVKEVAVEALSFVRQIGRAQNL